MCPNSVLYAPTGSRPVRARLAPWLCSHEGVWYHLPYQTSVWNSLPEVLQSVHRGGDHRSGDALTMCPNLVLYAPTGSRPVRARLAPWLCSHEGVWYHLPYQTSVWNSLPVAVHFSTSLALFRKTNCSCDPTLTNPIPDCTNTSLTVCFPLCSVIYKFLDSCQINVNSSTNYLTRATIKAETWLPHSRIGDS